MGPGVPGAFFRLTSFLASDVGVEVFSILTC
jgi:hypothetical protein